jgi:hypothetical protein
MAVFIRQSFFASFLVSPVLGCFTAKTQSLFSLWAYIAKVARLDFVLFFVVLVKIIECRSLLFLPGNDILNYENDESSFENSSPSPDGRENPFVPGFGTKDYFTIYLF